MQQNEANFKTLYQITQYLCNFKSIFTYFRNHKVIHSLSNPSVCTSCRLQNLHLSIRQNSIATLYYKNIKKSNIQFYIHSWTMDFKNSFTHLHWTEQNPISSHYETLKYQLTSHSPQESCTCFQYYLHVFLCWRVYGLISSLEFLHSQHVVPTGRWRWNCFRLGHFLVTCFICPFGLWASARTWFTLT